MKYVPPIGGTAGAVYVDGDPSSGVEGSAVPAAAIEHPMREIEALIEDFGLTPSASDLTQLAKAVRCALQRIPSSTGVASGSADAITATYSPAIAELTNGMTLYVRAASSNGTTSPTFTPNAAAISAKIIVKGAGVALAVGDIAGAGHWLCLQYDAALDKWVLLNPATGILSVTKQAGEVCFFATSSAPSGFLKANGASVSRTSYAALFSVIGTTFGAGDGSTTFNLPDLRGEFVRGWDDGRGVDSARVLGSAQMDAFKSHTHTLSETTGDDNSNPGGATRLRNNEYVGRVTGATGGAETRPRNVALLACISY